MLYPLAKASGNLNTDLFRQSQAIQLSEASYIPAAIARMRCKTKLSAFMTFSIETFNPDRANLVLPCLRNRITRVIRQKIGP